jgi:hypothetical protein
MTKVRRDVRVDTGGAYGGKKRVTGAPAYCDSSHFPVRISRAAYAASSRGQSPSDSLDERDERLRLFQHPDAAYAGGSRLLRAFIHVVGRLLVWVRRTQRRQNRSTIRSRKHHLHA